MALNVAWAYREFQVEELILFYSLCYNYSSIRLYHVSDMINTRWTAVWVLYWARIHGKTSQTNRTVDGLWLKTQHGAKRPRRAATLELVSRNTEATAARSEPLSSFIAPSCSWISLHMQRHRRETWCVQGPPLQLVHCKTAVHFSQMSWLLVELFGILCVIFISVSIALPRV